MFIDRLSWYGPYGRAQEFGVTGGTPNGEIDIWVIDEQTGIVYQGYLGGGSVHALDMTGEVRDFLENP